MNSFLSTTVLGLGLAMAASPAQAQATISFGPRLGLNISTFNYKYANTPAGLSTDTKSLVGVQVGATANIAFGKLAFQPSVLYTQKGAELVLSATDNTDPQYTTSYKASFKPTLGYLEIPLNVVYTAGEDHGFQLFAGPYLAFGVGGSGEGTIDIASDDPTVRASGAVGSHPVSLTVEYADQQNANASNNSNQNSLHVTSTFRRFDAGLNVGVGYRMGPVQGQLGYGIGLVNLVPKDTNGNDTGGTAYNRVLQLSATYFFAKK